MTSKPIFVSRSGSSQHRIELVADQLCDADDTTYEFLICQRLTGAKGSSARYGTMGPLDIVELKLNKFGQAGATEKVFGAKPPGTVEPDPIVREWSIPLNGQSGLIEETMFNTANASGFELSASTKRVAQEHSAPFEGEHSLLQLDRDEIRGSQAMLFEVLQECPPPLTQIHIGIAATFGVPIICFSHSENLIQQIKEFVDVKRAFIVPNYNTSTPPGSAGPPTGRTSSTGYS